MALATITIWSFSFLFIVQLNRELSPIGVVVARFDIYGLFVLALLVFRRPSIRHLTRKQWAIILGLSIVGGPLYHNVFSWSAGTNGDGVSRIDPALLGLILATVPVHTGWLGRVFLREKLSPARITALTLGLVGVAVVLFGRYGTFNLLPEQLEGPIAATVAAMLGAGIAVYTRAARTVYTPVDLVIVCGVLMVGFNAVLHPWAGLGDVAHLTTRGWIAAVFLGVFGLGVAFLTWATAMRGLAAVTAATYLFMASVLAALWGWLFDGTPVGPPFAAGAGLVLAGLLVMAWAGRRDARAPRPGRWPASPVADQP
jgi:drug/metabolite transporter (DMT)-like permease